MVKTLRITSVVAAIAAVVFIVFPGVFGARSDKQISEFLSRPGVVEKFKQAKGSKGKAVKDKVSPLVKAAKAFALYLNPPKPPKPAKSTKRSVANKTQPVVKPKSPDRVSA